MLDTNGGIFEWMQSPDNPKLLILMRGIASSGKSTRAKELAAHHDCHDRLFSADDFFGVDKETYVANWKREHLTAAHRQCRELAQRSMQRQHTPIIVDNTNVRIADMMPYFCMAVQYEYRVQIEEPKSPWWVNDIAPYLGDKITYAKEIKAAAKLLHEKSKATHCVPLFAIEKMLDKWMHNVTFEDLRRCYSNYVEDPLDDIEVS